MRANLGGQIAPGDVVGRDNLIANIWRALEKQSVVLTAARRMGKTSIVKKMQAEAITGFLPVYHDLEGLRSPLEFVETVYRDVEAFLTTRGRATKRAQDFIAAMSGSEIKGVVKLPVVLAPHWKTLLQKVAEDLSEHRDETVLFFWDEMPMMLENIKQDHGEKAAMEVFDTLRALRQTYPRIRMVYTGSIGLHHVVTSLKRSGYANAPTNDMRTIDVPPLAPADAQRLASLLLTGENIASDDHEGTAALIAKGVDNVAFYIHHVVDRLTGGEGTADANAVRDVVTACLIDSQDAWDMKHYRDRISTYYLPEDQSTALHWLDVFAAADHPIPWDEAFSLLSVRAPNPDAEQAREVLSLLRRDHYLIQQPDGSVCFYLPLIQRWWRLHRGLPQ